MTTLITLPVLLPILGAAVTVVAGRSAVAQRVIGIVVLVAVAVFAAVLFVPALSTYFGLIGLVPPVFTIVLPALVLWFAALTAAFRIRLLDRVLGLDELLDPRGQR